MRAKEGGFEIIYGVISAVIADVTHASEFTKRFFWQVFSLRVSLVEVIIVVALSVALYKVYHNHPVRHWKRTHKNLNPSPDSDRW